MTRPRTATALVGALLLSAGACSFDQADRWYSDPVAPVPACTLGAERCVLDVLQRCQAVDGEPGWSDLDDCAATDRICSPARLSCVVCEPDSGGCDGQTQLRCESDGSGFVETGTCEHRARPCRAGACVDLCALAAEQRSNVGCEYWAADLDNANVSLRLNAAAQQFAVVVSNPQPDVTAEVVVERDEAAPGAPGEPTVVASDTLAPLGLRVFRLGPREVDGSEPGTYDTGTHTALTRAAYRITSDVPIIAYQFNPLENQGVFSNDASLLKPVEALSITPGTITASYVVLGWPQTIASTDHPDTNFDPDDPTDLRAFLTIVGTRPATRVRVSTTTRILGATVQTGSDLPHVPVGGQLEVVLDAFDVLNLETDDFNADFTGSLIESDQPLVVFSGSEASDAPFYSNLADRRCCADHLEEQLDPVRTAGRRFVATVSPSRTRAVVDAGGDLGVVPQPEYFRVIATAPGGARVTTTLADYPTIELPERGSFADLESVHHFMIESVQPIMLGTVSPSQDAAGVPRGLPGGDPSFLLMPPIEQFRSNYVFLTPDKYDYDFVRIVASPDAVIVFDNQALSDLPACHTDPADGLDADQRGAPHPPFVVHTCQLSFPRIWLDAAGETQFDSGLQNDGVHRIESSSDIGVLVNGFDSYVSYAYAAGTELTQIAVE